MRNKLIKEIVVEWSYPAIPKPVYNCRMRHSKTGSYIHTNGQDQKNVYDTALKLITKQIKDRTK
jgi:hypothetical protein